MTHAPIPEHGWRKSTYSGNNGGECVQWAPNYAKASHVVPVRDSKDPQGPTLLFASAIWSSFIEAVRDGEFPTTA